MLAGRISTPRVADWMRGHHAEDFVRRTRPLLERGAPEELTGVVFRLLDQFPLLDVIDIADIEQRDEAEVADLYYALDARLGRDRKRPFHEQLTLSLLKALDGVWQIAARFLRHRGELLVVDRRAHRRRRAEQARDDRVPALP